MKLLIFMSSMLFITSVAVPDIIESNPEVHSETSYLDMDECHLFQSIFGTTEDTIIDIEDISVIALEENLDIGINTKLFLPKDFNASKKPISEKVKICSKKKAVL